MIYFFLMSVPYFGSVFLSERRGRQAMRAERLSRGVRGGLAGSHGGKQTSSTASQGVRGRGR